MTSAGITALIARARDGGRPSEADALSLAECSDIAALMQVAAELRDRGHGDLVSYSRKVFIPLTKLCRDSCHYCTGLRLSRRPRGDVRDRERRVWSVSRVCPELWGAGVRG
jgi:2-iminoacetate synthase ThiH